MITFPIRVRQLILEQSGEKVEEDCYACVWTRNPDNGTPLLCVAGNGALIKIIDATTGKLLRV